MSKIHIQIGRRSMRFWIVAVWCAFCAICAQAQIDPQAEKGDAVFRDLFKVGINVGHTGIYYGYILWPDNQRRHTVIQASGTGGSTSYAVDYRPFDDETVPPTFLGGLAASAYWGAGNRSTLSPATWDGSANLMTAARRDAIITEAQQLIGTAYCWYWGIWEDSYGNDGSVSCEPRSVYRTYPTFIRCDGVVQWVYERVGFNMGDRYISIFDASPYPSDRAGRFYVASVDTPSSMLQDNGTGYTIKTTDNSSNPTFVEINFPNGIDNGVYYSPCTVNKVNFGTTSYRGVDLAGHTESWKTFTYWQVTATAGSGGSISPSGSIVKNNGTSQTFTASPNANYVVNQWLVDGSVVQNGSNSYTLSNVTTSRNVQVTFGCTLTVNNGTGSGKYLQGQSVLIAANTPAVGKYFDRWTGATQYVASVTSSTTIVTMPAKAATLTATYKTAYYTLTVNGGTGGGSYTNGQRVTIKATVPSGWAFSRWTGGTQYVAGVTSLTAIVTMPTNAVVCAASFKDILKPVLTVSSPKTGLRLTNALVKVIGKATDNSGAADVLIRLNAGDWQTNSVLLRTTNWTANLTLQPGINVVRTCARDAAGNISITNTLNLTYVLYGSLNIQTNGPGTITRSPTGVPEVGKSYTLTAVPPKTGGKFSRWSGDSSSTNKTVTFIMTSNKTFTANFTDTAKPTVVVTYPTASMRVMTNGTVVLRGTAADNGRLNEVRYQLRTGEWTNTVSTNGWKNWTANFYPEIGLNTARVYSVDVQDNVSATSTVVFTYVPGAVMQVQTNGAGTITPVYNRKVLEIGKSYIMTAKVASGSVFTNWTYGIGGTVATNKAAVTFVMRSNLVLTANFRRLLAPATVAADIAAMDMPATAQAAITVDGSAKDWANVPRSSFSYASVTQEVAVVLDGNSIALLLNGCPFDTSDTVLVYFKLRLSYGDGDDRHTVDLWTSGSVLYGMVDGKVITGLEAVLLNGMLEVKLPVDQAPSQVTIEEIGCGIDSGTGGIRELFKIANP